uniref:Transposase (Putative), gypsy type n=1 Tax=Tanacetum cinerariifolium TaxID=118510 RepID=A0A6L2P0F8_TANCI|nr:transposase (putative), gypsy type [Tanacetum cinerariifolium]
MHERPAGKIRLYTRFFDFANFRLPLSTFFVDVLRHFRINISQLSMIGAAKKWISLLLSIPRILPSELEASVDRLFDYGDSGNQTEEGSFAEGEQGANIQPVVEAIDTFVENLALVDPRRFVISPDSSHHSGTNVTEVEVDSLIRSFVSIMTTATTTTSTVDPTLVTKEKLAEPSPFGAGSSLAGGTDPTTGVYVSQWSMTNGSRLDDSRVYREMVDKFAPLKFFASARGMEHDQLFTEFNVRAACQMSLSAKVRMRAEYNVKEKRMLKSVVERQDELLKTDALRERNVILEKEQNALDVNVTELETSAAGKEHELTKLNALITSVKS